jgi:hypothetical protein
VKIPLIKTATKPASSIIGLRNIPIGDIHKSSTNILPGRNLSSVRENSQTPRDKVSDAVFNNQDIANHSTPISQHAKKEALKGDRIRQYCRYNLRRKPKQVQRYGDFVEY